MNTFEVKILINSDVKWDLVRKGEILKDMSSRLQGYTTSGVAGVTDLTIISDEHRNVLRDEIENAINRNCAENGSNTPDYILAQYLIDCLSAFDKAINRREEHSKGNQNEST